jgi:hypothetical protein
MLRESEEAVVKRTLWIMVGLVAVLTLVAGFSLRDFFNPGAHLDSEDVRFADHLVEALVRKFEDSQARPLFQGETFPELSLPIVRGSAPDFTAPMVLTVGRAAESSASELHQRLIDTDIQKVHVLAVGPVMMDNLPVFPEDVLILDGTDQGAGGLTPDFANDVTLSRTLHEQLGLHAPTAVYLVDADGRVLYAQVNEGDFSGAESAVRAFVQNGTRGVRPNDQALLPVGEPLPLTSLPADTAAELQAELQKPVSLVMYSDATWCDVCDGWLAEGERFLQTWLERGYGVVLLEGGHERTSVERLSSGALRVFDVHLPGSRTESQLASSWGLKSVPVTMVLENGELTGLVSWLEVDINGKSYRDLHFRAVERVVQALVTPSDHARGDKRFL